MISLRRFIWAACVAGLAMPGSAAVVVDGDLSDWGITPGNNTTTWGGISTTYPFPSNSSPNGGSVGNVQIGSGPGAFNFAYKAEDSTDTTGSADHGFQVGPLYGGQDYDAEFLGVGFDGGNLVIAIMSGQRPDNGSLFFSPGDIRIDTGTSLFGVEVGGVFSGNVLDPTVGTTWALNSNGTTSSGTSNGRVAGTVWATAENQWQTNTPLGTTPVQMIGGSAVNSGSNQASYKYVNLTGSANTHSVIEVSIPIAWLGLGTSSVVSVQWGPSCGNDLLTVSSPAAPAPSSVPEPSTLALMGMGGFGMAFRSWRRKKTA